MRFSQNATAIGAGEFLHKLNIPEFHNEPTLVGAEELADFRLTDGCLKAVHANT